MGTVTATEGAALHWYRGNLHMHSFWSDGHHFPEMVARHFKDAGYHFIAFTEHDRFQTGDKWIPVSGETGTGRTLRESGFLDAYRDTFGADWVETECREDGEYLRVKALSEYRDLVEEPGRFLILNGEEVTAKSEETSHWINVFNAPEAIGAVSTPGDAPAVMNATVARAAELASGSGRAVMVSLNHPNYVWNATAEDIAEASELRFFEIHTALNCTFSYGDEVYPGVERLWDIALSKRLSHPGGQLVYGIATDDCHVYHRTDSVPPHERGSSTPCRAWVMVRAPELTPDALVAAMGGGDFYASSGVGLSSLEADGGGLRLSVRPGPGVRYTVQFIGTPRGTDLEGEPSAGGDRVTRTYSDEVGQVLQETKGSEARYDFSGDELYVRALITSDAPHPNPTVPGDTLKAWTQPVVPGR